MGGGYVFGIDISASSDNISFSCQDAIARFSTRYGLVSSINMYCPVAEAGEFDQAAQSIQPVINHINANEGWYIERYHLEGGRRARTIEEAFSILESDPMRGRQVVHSLPLISWRSTESRLSIDLNASIHYRQGDNRLRYELVFDEINSCIEDISFYESHSNDGDLDSEYFDNRILRELFSDRPYSSIPDEERVALTHQYATELCENTSTW